MSDNYIWLTKVPDTDLTRWIRFVLKSKHRMSKFRLKLQNLLPSNSFAYMACVERVAFKFDFVHILIAKKFLSSSRHSKGHFPVQKTLTFKTRRSVQPFLKYEFYLYQNKKSFPYHRLST